MRHLRFPRPLGSSDRHRRRSPRSPGGDDRGPARHRTGGDGDPGAEPWMRERRREQEREHCCEYHHRSRRRGQRFPPGRSEPRATLGEREDESGYRRDPRDDRPASGLPPRAERLRPRAESAPREHGGNHRRRERHPRDRPRRRVGVSRALLRLRGSLRSEHLAQAFGAVHLAADRRRAGQAQRPSAAVAARDAGRRRMARAPFDSLDCSVVVRHDDRVPSRHTTFDSVAEPSLACPS